MVRLRAGLPRHRAGRAAPGPLYIALSTAVVTFVAWWAAGSLGDSVVRTVTLLVIACPHALGLAIPLVIAISLNAQLLRRQVSANPS